MIREERRKFPRLLLSVGVEYKVLNESVPPSSPVTTYSKNISVGGICIILLEEVKIDTVLDLTFLLSDCKEIIKAQGKVVWLREFVIGVNQSIRGYEAGVEFTDISEENKIKINEYVMEKRI